MTALIPASMSNGEGSSSSSSGAGRGGSSTLGDAMRAPSINAPEVVVLDALPPLEDYDRREVLDPKEDLWLTSADGRYNSPIIPVRVGTAPYQEVFQVHKSVIIKAEWFRKALCGDFEESHTQSLFLPEEDPAIFHFIIAYLYEGRYVPTKPLSSVLIPDPEKGKGRENSNDSNDSDSDSSTASFVSDSSARSRRRRERRRRRDERHFERLRQKHPGMHRPQCNCPQCLNTHGPPCWSCSAPRVPPPPLPPPGVVVVPGPGPDRSRRHRNNRRGPPPPPTSPPRASPDSNGGGRISGEDMRTWLMTYELNIDVYICANKFLMDDFKEHISRATIDMLETAGSDAAQLEVLLLCRKLYGGLSESDSLLKMVFARIGFLQPILWRRAAEETNEFLITNPEVGALILKETAARREEDFPGGRVLPSMERPWFPPHMPMGRPHHHYQHHHGHRPPRPIGGMIYD